MFSGIDREEPSDLDTRYFTSSLREAGISYLTSTGKTSEEATALLLANAEKASRELSAVNTSAEERRVFSEQSKRRIVSRYGQRVEKRNISSNPAIMKQVTASGTPSLSYEFIHKPNQISYSNIGSEWSTIERSANRALINWKAYKLMQITFEFLVAPDLSGTLDDAEDEGVIKYSVDSQLRTLRNMAADPIPVVFSGFDDMFRNSLDSQVTGGSGVEFVIADFSITSSYRTSTGEINRATCQITLQETPAKSTLDQAVFFPRLKPVTKLPGSGNPGQEKEVGCGNLATGSLRENKNFMIYDEKNKCWKRLPPPTGVFRPGGVYFG